MKRGLGRVRPGCYVFNHYSATSVLVARGTRGTLQGEPQPNQSGSEMWDESDFKYTPQGGVFPDTMKCASCETRFSVAMPSKMFGAAPWKL